MAYMDPEHEAMEYDLYGQFRNDVTEDYESLADRLSKKVNQPVYPPSIRQDFATYHGWGRRLWRLAFHRLWATWSRDGFPMVADFASGIEREIWRRDEMKKVFYHKHGYGFGLVEEEMGLDKGLYDIQPHSWPGAPRLNPEGPFE